MRVPQNPISLSINAPMDGSIDSMISWLRSHRASQPNTPLSQLVDVSAIPQDRMTDIACIDLIERKRIGQEIRVEDYLHDIPALGKQASSTLDLIDAEICVQTELGHSVDFQDYANRFPEHKTAIEELLRLNGGAPIVKPAAKAPLLRSAQTEDIGYASESRSHTNVLEHSIQPPSWFTREQLHSSTERSCLIRGRDSNENRAVALKIIRLTNNSRQAADFALAEVEAASQVRHPAWVQPDVATVEAQRLAVIRPWIFGMRWDIARRNASLETRLHDLARVGYALQSAHDTTARIGHAVHGGLHLNNLIVDSDGQIRIVDAATCVQPSAGEMFAAFGQEKRVDAGEVNSQPWAWRRLNDIRALGMLIRMATVSDRNADSTFAPRLVTLERICHGMMSDRAPADACAQMADAALKLADGKLPQDNMSGPISSARAWWKRFRHRSS